MPGAISLSKSSQKLCPCSFKTVNIQFLPTLYIYSSRSTSLAVKHVTSSICLFGITLNWYSEDANLASKTTIVSSLYLIVSLSQVILFPSAISLVPRLGIP